MGQEIANTRFKHLDFQRYEKLLRHEMDVLQVWFREGRFSSQRSVAGLELEAWLVDDEALPKPWNEQIIALAGSPDIVPELSRFNVEFNVHPQKLAGQGLAELAAQLEKTWSRCEAAANQVGASVMAIGILPTISDSLLSLGNMSNLHRYRALNEQILRMRQGRPIRLQLQGKESLASEHRDVMLESAATSFQLHLQVAQEEAVRYYNASLISSAPLVAATGNSPFLFGSLLWEETRIPLFEQSIDVGHGAKPRVSFGSGYAVESLLEVFRENVETYPVLLPLAMEEASERLVHARLLNGTIWRWNRPLIGFDDDGTPHLRIEQRVMPAGPTLADMTANLALYYGLVENLAHESPSPESRLSFPLARDGFYHAAKFGLECRIPWLDGSQRLARELLLTEILPRAAEGLHRLHVDTNLAKSSLNLIAERVQTGQTGAVWQRRYLEQHGRNAVAMTQAYRELQDQGEPVHTWPIARNQLERTRKTPRSMLQLLEELPPRLLTADARDLADLLKRPTLIHLPGLRAEPLFVSIMLHGNEDVGLKAVQSCLQKYHARPLPRALSLFVGNVVAAQQNVRRLPNQPDYNRVWPGSDLPDSPERALMWHVVEEMRSRGVYASVDLHNNTGWNPHYACVTQLDLGHLHLASLFGRTAVFFQQPRGVQTMAFAPLCPSVTCECGKVGDEAGVQHAEEFLDACLHLAEIPQKPLPVGDLHLFHTVATVKIAERVDVEFQSLDASPDQENGNLILRSDLERLNFQELAAGLQLGWSHPGHALPMIVTDHSGRNVTTDYLKCDAGRVELCQDVIPAMLTSNHAVMRQDCLGYFMERYPLPGETTGN